MNKEWKPRPPGPATCCIICGEEIGSASFIASKPRRGRTIYAHTRCLAEEQKALKGGKE